MSAAKRALRREVLARRDASAPAQRAAWSTAITARLLALSVVRDAGSVLAYLSFGSEFDTAALVSCLLERTGRVALPRVNRETGRLDLYFVSDPATQLAPGVWGIREPLPDGCVAATLDEMELVIAPGVAFTAGGDRLGYGGGYYDRLLCSAAVRPPCVAAAFALQVVPALPCDETDVRMDLVVTETGPLAA